jgi:hypothetical protein
MKGYLAFLTVGFKDDRTAPDCLPRWAVLGRQETLAGTVKDGGGRGTHWSSTAVDGEAAAGSQEGRAASGSVSSPGGDGSCGGPGVSSNGGAPWHIPTVTLPANSAQGKGPWGLAEVKEAVFGGKGGRGERGEGGHLLGASQRVLALSPSPSAVRRRGWAALPRL